MGFIISRGTEQELDVADAAGSVWLALTRYSILYKRKFNYFLEVLPPFHISSSPAYKVRLKSIFAIFDQLSTHTISNVDDETILHQDSNNVDLVL
jgi:hypothetical protein